MKKLLVTVGLAVIASVTAHAGGFTQYYGNYGQSLGHSYNYGNGFTQYYGNYGQSLGHSYHYGWGQ